MANEFKVKNGLIVDQGGANITGSSFITGSLTVSSGITGSLFGSASYAFTASYALNAGGASIDTGSFATTGSNRFVGNQIVTGSLLTSGSNTLIGNTSLTGSLSVSGSTTIVGTTNFSNSTTTITGSFLVSGSTTQIGNNNLLGNTSLSGSLIVSGSQGSTIPTIQIYGDLKQSGYHRFDSVSTNIDTSISASYIYVSGSTNDLYFSQNSKGYNNVTRLRWLEGNLYTGLLNGGLVTTQSSTVYQVSSGSGIVVSLNTSLNDNPYPTIKYLSWPNLSASIAPFSASYDQTFIAVYPSGSNSAPAILAQGTPFNDGQFDTAISVGLVLHSNHSTINGWKTQPSVAYGIAQRQNVFTRAFGPLKLSGFPLAVSGSSTGSLIIGSGTAYADGAYYAIDTNNPSYVIDSGTNVSKIWRYYNTSSYTSWNYDTNNGAGYGAIDPARYSNNGVLTAVPGTGANREWSIQRVYWFPNSTSKAIVVYYGNATYLTEIDAIANISVESFVEAPNTATNAVYIGSLVLQNNADFTDIATYKIVPGGLFRNVGGSGGGGSVITQTLAGLSDVGISGPTNGQPLVYNSVTAKWENQSTLTATLVGNASTATSASYASTASVAPAYVLNSSTSSMLAPYVLSASTGSFVTNSQTSSMSVLSSSYAATAALAPNYVLNSVTASMLTPYVLTSSTSSMSVLSSSFAATASSAENFTVRGTLTAQTIVVQTITSSIDYVTGSSRFGSLQSNTHQFTGSVSITGSLSVNSAVINSLTSSYAMTASYWSGSVLNSTSASYAATAALAPSYVLNSSTASFVTNSQTSSFVTNSQTSSMSVLTSSYAGTASLAPAYVLNSSTSSMLTPYVLTSVTSSMLSPYVLSSNTGSFITNSQTSSMSVLSASFASTASFVNILNQNVIISGSLTVGTSSIGANENTITLGARDTINEGGQIGFNAPGGTYTSASFIDNWQNKHRILRGSNTTSDATVAAWDLHTKQMQLPQYTNASSFAGTATANLAVDSNGNVITVSTTGGSVFPYTGNAVITGSLTVTQPIYVPINGGMYFQGGDDAALYDINVVNTLGVYGVQDSTIASIKIGSGGGTISGRSGNIGIGTITPNSASLHVSGNIFATSLTGSLLGTSSWSNNSVSSSYAATASLAPNYVLNSSTSSFITNSQTSSMTVLSSSFASTASYINPLIQNIAITGSINISGSTIQTGSFTLNNNAGTVTTFAGDPFTFARIGNTLSFFAAAGGVGNNSVIYSNSTLRLGGGSNAAQIVLDSSGNKTGINKDSPNAALDVNGNTIITGSLQVTLGITGSLFGTSSWSQNAISSSFASTASLAPLYVLTSATSSMSVATASYVLNSISSSYAATAALAPNYVLNSSTSSMLLPYVLTSVTASMLSPYVLSSNTGSFITNSQTSSMTVLSASFASTASSAENFTVRGTLTAQTIIVQTITSSIDFITGSTRFGSASTSTHQFTGSVSVTGSLAVNGSNVILNNQTSSMSVATASYVLNSVSSSYAATASLAPLYVLNSSTSSFVVNSQTASFVTNNQTSSFATTGSNRFIGDQTITGSLIISSSAAIELTVIGNQTNTGSLIVTQGITGSLQGTSSWANNSITASYITASNVVGNVTSASYAISSSYALTASYARNSPITIADEGTVQGTVTFLNFIGSAVTATVSSNTGSITITGGSGGGLATKSGAVTNTSFTGTPRKATITFSAAFPNTSYGIVVTGADLRSWTIESKSAGSFIINTNSNAALTGDTYWVATAYGETA